MNMITMRVEVDIAEYVDTLHAREEIAKRIHSQLVTAKWIKSVRIVYE